MLRHGPWLCTGERRPEPIAVFIRIRHRATEPRELGRDMDRNMTRSRNLTDACFRAAVWASQAFIAVVAGVAFAFALWS